MEVATRKIARLFIFNFSDYFCHKTGYLEARVGKVPFLKVFRSGVLILAKLILKNLLNIRSKINMRRLNPICLDLLPSSFNIFRALSQLASHSQ